MIRFVAYNIREQGWVPGSPVQPGGFFRLKSSGFSGFGFSRFNRITECPSLEAQFLLVFLALFWAIFGKIYTRINMGMSTVL